MRAFTWVEANNLTGFILHENVIILQYRKLQ